MTHQNMTGTRPLLTADDVRRRLGDHIYVLYLNYAFFIKGAVIAVAALSIYLILMPDIVQFRYERTAMWTASVGASLLTIATWARGATLTNARANVFDIVLPVAIGICEVLLYTTITPPTESLAHSVRAEYVWVFWYLFFGVHAFLAAGLVTTRLVAAAPGEFQHDEILEPIWKQYRDWMKFDIAGACTFGCLGLGLFVGCETWPYLLTAAAAPVHIVTGVALFVIFMFITVMATNQYKALSRM